MRIKRMSQVGVASIVLVVALGAGLAGSKINEIRFGGPLQTSNQRLDDLLADTLPPRASIIESYLEASQLVSGEKSVGQGKARLAELEKQYHDRMTYWKGSELSPTLKAMINGMAPGPAAAFWSELNGTFIPAVEAGQADLAKASFGRLFGHYAAHRTEIDALVKAATRESGRVRSDAEASLKSAYIQLGTLAVLLFGALGFAGWFVTRRIVAPLVSSSDAMTRMAGGDYDVQVPGRDRDDEVGAMARSVEFFRSAALSKAKDEAAQKLVMAELAKGLKALAEGNLAHRIASAFDPRYIELSVNFNAAATELGRVVGQVAHSASSVRTGSSKVSTASDDLARRTEQQRASLEEPAAAMNQLATGVRETAECAATAPESVAVAHSEAVAGGEVVLGAVSAMGDIEKSAHEIAQIINVVDDIAFQTNLFALNAGVEAARAGCAGQGFAVVANDVRALAQSSADAAKDIKELINTLPSQVDKGGQLVGPTGEMLERIVAKVTEINDLASEVSISFEAEASHLLQFNSAVGNMDKMTQQNAAMVEKSNAAARSLASEADQLARLVAHFRKNASASSALAAKAQAPASKSRYEVSFRLVPLPTCSLALKDGVPEEDWSEFWSPPSLFGFKKDPEHDDDQFTRSV
jgi:methyl-accepting chemotaxis protein